MQKTTILVADDDGHVRASLRRRLSANGYHVVESTDGLGVLTQCVEGAIDAILLDHGMPNGDGRSIARVIRKECHVPIIFLSGYSSEQFKSIVMELPDVYYLAKPVDEGKLIDLLNTVIKPVPELALTV
jgi:two-component system, OmpR family, response regulator